MANTCSVQLTSQSRERYLSSRLGSPLVKHARKTTDMNLASFTLGIRTLIVRLGSKRGARALGKVAPTAPRAIAIDATNSALGQTWPALDGPTKQLSALQSRHSSIRRFFRPELDEAIPRVTAVEGVHRDMRLLVVGTQEVVFLQQALDVLGRHRVQQVAQVDAAAFGNGLRRGRVVLLPARPVHVDVVGARAGASWAWVSLLT